MKKFRQLDNEYKVAILIFFALIGLNVVAFIFILLPTYNLNGDAIGKNNDAGDRLERLQDIAAAFKVISYFLFLILAVAVTKGVLKNVRKSKKQS